MKIQSKKLLSVLVALAMIFAMLPTTVMAEDSSSLSADKGSLGFFEWLSDQGSTDAANAVQVLSSSGLSSMLSSSAGRSYEEFFSYTSVGAEGDATSLENLQATVAFLKECNELRVSEGLSELKVSYMLMAISEVQLNWSAGQVAHSLQYGVGENLAWGYSDPFDGWYTTEKENYETNNGGQTGHYENIINSSYTTTGFAVTQKGSYGIAHGQVFYWGVSGSVTVSEFESKLNEYIAALESEDLSDSGDDADTDDIGTTDDDSDDDADTTTDDDSDTVSDSDTPADNTYDNSGDNVDDAGVADDADNSDDADDNSDTVSDSDVPADDDSDDDDSDTSADSNDNDSGDNDDSGNDGDSGTIITPIDTDDDSDAVSDSDAGDDSGSIITPIETDDVVASGTCGDDLTWVLTSDGTLTISGTGNMEEYGTFNYSTGIWNPNAPWYDERESITKIVVEEGVVGINSFAFLECANVTEVTLPSSLTWIGYYAFTGCDSLKSITIPPSVVYISDSLGILVDSNDNILGSSDKICGYTYSAAYWYAQEHDVEFESLGTLSEGDDGYIGGALVTTGEIGSNVVYALYEDGSLFFCGYGEMDGVYDEHWKWDLDWLNFLKSYHSDVKYAYFTDGITSIGRWALGGYYLSADDITEFENLTSISIAESVETIGDWIIAYNTSITEFIVDEDNEYFKTVDNVLFSKDGTTLYLYPRGSSATTYTVPDGVETIGKDAFSYATSLVSITIPKSVTYIGGEAFDGCENLTDVYYAGAKEDRDEIVIASGNDELVDAAIWHYSDTDTDDSDTVSDSDLPADDDSDDDDSDGGGEIITPITPSTGDSDTVSDSDDNTADDSDNGDDDNSDNDNDSDGDGEIITPITPDTGDSDTVSDSDVPADSTDDNSDNDNDSDGNGEIITPITPDTDDSGTVSDSDTPADNTGDDDNSGDSDIITPITPGTGDSDDSDDDDSADIITPITPTADDNSGDSDDTTADDNSGDNGDNTADDNSGDDGDNTADDNSGDDGDNTTTTAAPTTTTTTTTTTAAYDSSDATTTTTTTASGETTTTTTTTTSDSPATGDDFSAAPLVCLMFFSLIAGAVALSFERRRFYNFD